MDNFICVPSNTANEIKPNKIVDVPTPITTLGFEGQLKSVLENLDDEKQATSPTAAQPTPPTSSANEPHIESAPKPVREQALL